jgi:hypothetical protein
VYFGSATPDATADWILSGAGGDEFGWSVAFAGLFNADAFDDVIVGAYVNAGGGGAGKAFIYHGGAAPDVVADLTLTGAAGNDNFGYSVASAGDFNADGFADVIVGALNNDTGGANAGRAQIFHGGPGADAVADRTFPGHVADERFGSSVAGAGDVNGDGFADVVVGAVLNDAGGIDAGRAYAYFGGPGADLVEDRTFTGSVAGGRFGHAVAGAGDANGDGHRDVLVGALFTSGNNGRADLFFGGPSGDNVVDRFFDGTAGERLGAAVGGGGDVNGDGRADLVLGADRNAANGLDAGAAYLVRTTSPLPVASPLPIALLGLLSVTAAVVVLRRRMA